MPGNLLHVNATVLCPHGGQAAAQPAQTRALVDGQTVTTIADFYTVTGCPFTVANKPQPCVTVEWTRGSARLRAGGTPVLLQDSTGVCYSADRVPQGAPMVTVVQQRGTGQ